MSSLKYLSSKSSPILDNLLMSPSTSGPSNPRFSLDQLMEIAGLAVAQCFVRRWPDRKNSEKVLIACGPGNQGGDGLVAARWIKHFGYTPTVFWPKQGKNQYYQALAAQLRSLQVPFLDPNTDFSKALKEHDILIDAIFGFSFHGAPRPPFDVVLKALHENDDITSSERKPVLSVDIPSGWSVDDGNIDKKISFVPDVLLSLTAPKLGARDYDKACEESTEKKRYQHWLGGRFVSPIVDRLFDLHLPKWPEDNLDQVMDITLLRNKGEVAKEPSEEEIRDSGFDLT